MVKFKKNIEKYAVLCWILLGALWYRFYLFLNVRDFWHDEAFQYLYSLKPVLFIISANDVHPPLFNLFTKLLLSIGITDYMMLRLVMIILSLVFIALFYFLVRDLFGEKTATLSSILLAMTPTYAFYSMEFRNYMFTLILVVVQIIYFNKLLYSENIKNKIMYGLFTTAMIYSHYLSGLILFTQFLYLGLTWTKNHLRYLKPLLWSGFFSIPLFFYTFSMVNKLQSFWFKDIDLISLVSTFSYIIAPPMERPIGLFFIYYGLLIFSLIYFRKKLDDRILQFLMYLYVPILTMWCISQYIPFYHHRYFLFGGIGLFVILGWALKNLADKEKYLDHCFLGFVGVIVVLSSGWLVNTFNTELSESARAVYFDTNNTTDEFITIHRSPFSQSPYRVYLPGHKAYLVTNLTTEMLFTAGGSVLTGVCKEINDCEFANESVYFVDSVPQSSEIIFDKGGLYVTKIH